MEKRHRMRQPEFLGPPYVDRSPGIFHDLHRAWQSIDSVKEKLNRTEKKLHTIIDEPLDLDSHHRQPTPSNLWIGQPQKGPWTSSAAPGARKRKVFRLESREVNGRPKPEVSELSKPKKEVRWSAVAEKEDESLPVVRYLDTSAFEQFKTDDPVDPGDLLVVPIRPLNDPVDRKCALTRVDVHLLRPPLPVDDFRKQPPLPVKATPPPHMMWVPIEPHTIRTRSKVEDHTSHLRSSRLTTGQHLTASNRSPDSATRKGFNAKGMKRKKTRCLPSSIQQSVINPHSWRRGQEVVLKELGPFVRPEPVKESSDGTDIPERDSSVSAHRPSRDFGWENLGGQRRDTPEDAPTESLDSTEESLPKEVRRRPEPVAKTVTKKPPTKSPDSPEESQDSAKESRTRDGQRPPSVPAESRARNRQTVEKLKSPSAAESTELRKEVLDSPVESKTGDRDPPAESRTRNGQIVEKLKREVVAKPSPKKTPAESAELRKVSLDSVVESRTKAPKQSGPKIPAKKPFKRDPAETEVKESTPKTRHYDAASIRKFMKAQREDRKRMVREQEAVRKSGKEQQRQKLEELRAKQKTLAKVAPEPMVVGAARKRTGAMTARVRDGWTWTDPEDQDRKEDVEVRQPEELDRIWDRILYAPNFPVRRRVVGKSARDREHPTVTKADPTTDTSKSSQFSQPRSPSSDRDPRARGDGHAAEVPEAPSVEPASKEVREASEKHSKLMSIRQQAVMLQALIEAETKRVSSRFQALPHGPSRMLSEPASQNDSSLSEGSLQTSNGHAVMDRVQHQIAINSVIAKSGLRLTRYEESGTAEEPDWRSLIPRRSPDPYSFFSVLNRRQESEVSKSAQQNAGGFEALVPVPAPEENQFQSFVPVPAPEERQFRSFEPVDPEPAKSVDGPKASETGHAAEDSDGSESSVSLSRHALPESTDTDDQLSEGTLGSISDISQMLGSAPRREATENDRQLLSEDHIETRVELRDRHSSADPPTRDSVGSVPQSNLDSVDMDTGVLKMSPNTLHLRMTTELSFLDNVQASLGQLQDLERIRSVSMAQQELARAVQAKQDDQITKRIENRAEDGVSGNVLRNSTIQLLKSQTEVTRISAEATKQLTEINKTILEQRGQQAAASGATEYVAAATAAAVTAALSQLKRELRQQKASRSHRTESSAAASRSSASDSSTSYSSGNSQKRSGPGPGGDGTFGSLPASVSEDVAVEAEAASERSFRALLPSESHRRSSLGSQAQQTASPGSDLSKNSSISEALSVSSEVPASPTSLDGSGLFKGEQSFQRFTRDMVKKYMEEEDMRTHHQRAITKLQEDASVRQTNEEVAWRKLHGRQNRAKSEDDRMPASTGEAKKPKSTPARTRDEKQSHLNSASKISVVPIITSKTDDFTRHSDPISSVTDNFSSSDIKSDLSASTLDEESEAQTAVNKGNGDGKSKMLALPSSPSTTRVLQGLKKLQVSKRYLTKREQKLLQRRKNVEELLRWQRELDQEEVKVQEMERKALKILSDKRQAASAESARESEETSGSKMREASVEEQLPSETSLPEELSSVEDGVTIASENSGTPVATEDTSATAVTRPNECPKAVTSRSSDSETSYSKETFEKLSVATARTETGSGDAPASPAGARKSSPKSRSIVLRSPLTPIRTMARKRCDSSGSEDSCTISQSETASDPSDIEGRIHALKKDLRQRKSEAERLKKEQKRKNVERLKEQEDSLLKQIEAYDRYIHQAKIELQKELEQDGAAKVLVKPVIMQPKVAESKRLQRQTAMDRSPEQEDKKPVPAIQTAALRDSVPAEEVPAAALRDAVHAEEAPDAAKSNSSADEAFSLDVSKESEEDGSKGNASAVAEDSEPETSKEDNATERERSLEDITVPAVETVPEDLDTDQSNIPAIEEDSLEGLEEDVMEDRTAQEDRSLGEAAEQPQCQIQFNSNQFNSNQFHSNQFHSNQFNSNQFDKMPIKTELPTSDDRAVSKDVLADGITDFLMSRLLSEETRGLHVRAAGNRDRVVGEPSKDEEVGGHRLAEHLLRDLVDEAWDAARHVRKSRGAVAGAAAEDPPACADKKAEESDEGKCNKDRCAGVKSSVSERVSTIMAEFSEKQSVLAAGSRQQDLMVLSFSEELAAYSTAARRITDPPSKSDPASPVRRPSSPVFGEPGELSPLDLEARLLSLQASEIRLDPEDLLSGDLEFDDDFGLSSPIQHYQIYNFPDLVYVREIPNKPPPPYTPPGKALAVPAPPPAAVSYDEEEIRHRVARAAEFYCAASGSEDRAEEEKAEDYAEEDRSRRIYDRFVTALTKEVVAELRQREAPPPRPPWLKPQWSAPAPKTPQELVVAARARALELLLPGPKDQRSRVKWGRKKRDFVDGILLQELRREEAEWVEYEADEVVVKERLADAILEDLIGQLVRDLKRTLK